MAIESIECPGCAQPVRRTAANRIDVVGPTTDTRGLFRRFRESTAEIDHTFAKAEADLERPIQAPSLWQEAKRRAAAMTAAGEASNFKPA